MTEAIAVAANFTVGELPNENGACRRTLSALRLSFGRLVQGMLLLFVCWSTAATAQDALPGECMQSFNVRPDLNVTIPSWLSNNPSSGQPLNCLTAEALREQLFRGAGSGAVTESDMAAAVAAQDALRTERGRLAERAAELRTVTTLDGLRTMGQLLFQEGMKYRAAYTCLAAETPPGFVACGGFVVALATQAYNLWKTADEGGIGPARAAAVAELDRQVAELDRAIAAGAPPRRSLDAARQQLLQTQLALCRAVREGCL